MFVFFCSLLTHKSGIVLCYVDALQSGASQFEANTGKLKRKYWWQNVKVGF